MKRALLLALAFVATGSTSSVQANDSVVAQGVIYECEGLPSAGYVPHPWRPNLFLISKHRQPVSLRATV